MLQVALSIIGIVGGVIAGAVPAFLVSERRRLLRFISDESKAVDEVSDPEALASLEMSLRASASRYQTLASQTRLERARRQLTLTALIAFFLLYASAPLIAFARVLSDSEETQRTYQVVGFGLAAVALVVLLSGVIRVYDARREERDDDRRRAERAEQALEEVETTLRVYREESDGPDDEPEAVGHERETESREVVDLLAALQRSVEAAKTAREEPSAASRREARLRPWSEATADTAADHYHLRE